MRIRSLIALAGATLMASCSVIVHDEDAAAKKATEFVRLAFIAHDAQASYPLISPETRQTLTEEKLAEVLIGLHPTGYPTTVTAIQYEPVPSQKLISIVLRGENANEKFFYRLVMAGTAPSGYTVGGLFRGTGPYAGNPQIGGAKLLQSLKDGYVVSK